MKPHEIAKAKFDKYAGLDSPSLPGDVASALQVSLYRWQARNFGSATKEQLALGVGEEAGELFRAILKHSQNIRGFGDKEVMREAAGDAIADIFIYAIQLCTVLRLDWYTLLEETANQIVQKRDWVANPDTGSTQES